MPSYTMLNVKLQRESTSVPWGFRMQGGKDFSCPLQIQKVNPGSLAERGGMQGDDYIIRIGPVSAEHLKHPDAQELIKQQDNLLELTLQRGAPPDTTDYNAHVQFPPHQLMESPAHQLSPPSQPRPPPQPPTPQIAMPIANNRAILSQGHNTPIGLYSAENVTETIARTLKSSPVLARDSEKNRDQIAPVMLTSSDVGDLQQKYLSMDAAMPRKSEARHGPAFRALVRGLDETDDPTDPPPSSNKPSRPQYVDPTTIKGFRYTPKAMNMGTDYKIEQPANYSEFQTKAVRSMPKPTPAPHHYSQPQQPRSASYASFAPSPYNQSKPSAVGKPPSNGGNQAVPRSENRVFMKGSKGSASLNQNNHAAQTATCYSCGIVIRGPYISAIGRCYCVDHFTCSNCSANLIDCGFVEDNGKLYCEKDFEQFLAPQCAKCSQPILKECVHALEKSWHPDCFTCTACRKSIGTGSFNVEEGEPYCTEDYRLMFQAKCTACEFPIEPGDQYLEAMGGTLHVECFNCSMCQVNLNGQPFVIKNDRPYCRQHAR